MLWSFRGVLRLRTRAECRKRLCLLGIDDKRVGLLLSIRERMNVLEGQVMIFNTSDLKPYMNQFGQEN